MTDKYGERGPWHSGDEKPEIDGVYERDYSHANNSYDCREGVVFSYFYMGTWFAYGKSIHDAEVNCEISNYLNLHWRGLAKKP